MNETFFFICFAALLLVNTTLAEESGVIGIIGALEMELVLL